MKKGTKTWLVTMMTCCLALSLGLLSGCAQQEKQEAESSQETQTTALIVYAQDGDYLFVDTQNETLFFPNLTSATITNSSGSKISSETLAVGDIVTVTGDGVMTMSYPAIYPNVSAVKISSRGNMDNVENYAETVAKIFSPASENGVPSGWLNYDTSVGNITLVLDAYASTGFSGESAASSEQDLSNSFADESGIIDEQVPDARFKNAIEATIGFSSNFQTVTVDRIPLAPSTNERLYIDLVTSRESVQSTVIGEGELTLSIEPGYIFLLNVEFANGAAHYAFTTLDY